VSGCSAARALRTITSVSRPVGALQAAGAGGSPRRACRRSHDYRRCPGTTKSEHGLPEPAVRRQVRTYVDEIIPHFNVLSYYKIGYNLAKIVVNLLYKICCRYWTSARSSKSKARRRRLPHDITGPMPITSSWPTCWRAAST